MNAPAERNLAMQTSPRGMDLIRKFEALRLEAYRDAVGVLTIGYGHTGADVAPGLVIDAARAEALLKSDLMRFEDAVRRHAGAAGQNQFDAMVSLAFNIGVTAFARSTLARRHKAGDHAGAAEEFRKWVHAGGRRLLGLVRRRAAERRLYLTADPVRRPA
jgi:lysozyme